MKEQFNVSDSFGADSSLTVENKETTITVHTFRYDAEQHRNPIQMTMFNQGEYAGTFLSLEEAKALIEALQFQIAFAEKNKK